MFAIKCGEFYFVSYDEDLDESIFSTGTYQCKKFETLEELDECVEEYNIEGYAVAVLDD